MGDTSLVFNIFAKDKSGPTFDKMKAGAALAGAAIGAALASAVAAGLEQSKAQAVLAAQLGATPALAGRLGEISGNLYARGVATEAAEASNALKAVWQNGIIDEGATNAEIEAVSAKVMNLTQLMGEEADRTSAAVANMLRNGLAKSSDEAIDILTAGMQRGVNKSQDLLDTFNEYGPQFRKLGLDGPRSMGLLSQAIQAGARDSDTAADALKEFAIRAADGSTKSAAGFKAIGLSAKEMTARFAAGGPGAAAGLDLVLDRLRAMKDPVARETAAVALFGTKAEDLQASLFAMDPSAATAALGDFGGAAQRAGDTLEQSTGARVEAFKRKAQQALIDTLAKAVPYIEATFGWLSRNSAWVTPLAVALGILATVIGVIVAAMKVWAVVQTVLNLALWTSPITWIVLGVLLLVGAIVLIATKTTWFQDIWRVAWGWIKGAALAVWNWIKTNWPLLLAILTGPIGLAVLWIVRNWDKIKNAARATWDFIKSKVSSFASWIMGIPGRISSKLSSMWNGLWFGFKAIVNRIIGGWNRLSFGIPGFSFAGVSFPGISIGTPDIPYLAKGGTATTAGLAVVGERGPELVSLSKGAQVTPLRRGGAGGAGGTLRLDLRGEREIVALFRRLIRTANLLQEA